MGSAGAGGERFGFEDGKGVEFDGGRIGCGDAVLRILRRVSLSKIKVVSTTDVLRFSCDARKRSYFRLGARCFDGYIDI